MIDMISVPQWPYRGVPENWYAKDGSVCLNFDCELYQKKDGQWGFVGATLNYSHTCPSCAHTWREETPMSESELREARSKVEDLKRWGYDVTAQPTPQ